jgi:hypothetical protein
MPTFRVVWLSAMTMTTTHSAHAAAASSHHENDDSGKLQRSRKMTRCSREK